MTPPTRFQSAFTLAAALMLSACGGSESTPRTETDAAAAPASTEAVAVPPTESSAPGPADMSASLVAEVGATRPVAQEAEGAPGIPFVPVSTEQLRDHDADLLLLPVSALFYIAPITESPLFAGLDAVAGGAVHEVVGDHRALGGSAFGIWWMLDDLESMVTGGEPATIDDAVSLWSEFLTSAS